MDKENQIEIFEQRLEKVLNFKKTYQQLKKEGLITASYKFFNNNIDRHILKIEKDIQIQTFFELFKEINNFKKTYQQLKKEGKITFGTTFFRNNCYEQPKITIKRGKIKEAQLILNYVKTNNCYKKEAYKSLKKEGKITFALQTLLVQIRIIENQKVTKDFIIKDNKDAINIKIINEWNSNYFEGRVMTLEVKEAFKQLGL